MIPPPPGNNLGLPAISVVMSCFNGQMHVHQAVQSIREQTFQDWELIIVNDGSTDQTPDILDRFAAEEPRIKVVHQTNSGLTRALIRGCEHTRGEFIARQDADDISLPERLEQQYMLMQSQPQLGFVSSFADYIGPNNEYLRTETRPTDPSEATRRLLEERLGPPAHGSVMFRASLYRKVGGYRPDFYFSQDSDLWLRLADVSHLAYVASRCYVVRLDASGITGTNRALQHQFGLLCHECRRARLTGQSEAPFLACAAKLTSKLLEQRRTGAAFGTTRDRRSANYLIGSQLIANRNPHGRKYLLSVVREAPWHWRAWLRLAQSLYRSGSEHMP